MNSCYGQVVALSLCTFLDLSLKQSESGLQIDESMGAGPTNAISDCCEQAESLIERVPGGLSVTRQ
jgi:hypothetical protein